VIVSSDEGTSETRSHLSTQYQTPTSTLFAVPSSTSELIPNESPSAIHLPAGPDSGGGSKSNIGLFIGIGLGIPLLIIALLALICMNWKDETVSDSEDVVESEECSEFTTSFDGFEHDSNALTNTNEDVHQGARSSSFDESTAFRPLRM
jgi:hypothetical protein